MSALSRRLALHAALCGLLWPALPALAFLDVNQASAHDLEAIKGIGPRTRERLLGARQLQPFTSWADLIQRVSGIGPARAVKLSAQGLTVNGQAYQPGASAPAGPAAGAGSGLGAPGPMPSGVPWHGMPARPSPR